MNAGSAKRDQYVRISVAGFTLIEMCFVILISGLFSLSFLKYYIDYSEKQRIAHTEDAINQVQGAVREYLSEEGKYPCPAPSNLDPTSPFYGQPDCDGTRTTIVEGRDADGDGTGDDVIIGSLPVKFLIKHYSDFNLDMDVPVTEAAVLDGWGYKLTYAVTRSLADPDPAFTFNARNGAIKVVDEHDQDITPQEGNAHFVIVSHGPNGVGGYTQFGRRSEDCTPIVIPGGLPSTTIVTPVNERDNCDYADNKFVSGLRNLTEYSKFDDVLRYYAFQETDLWRVAPTADYRIYNTNTGNVGIIETAPIQRLDVAGRIDADRIMAEKVCDRGGTDCLIINAIAGDDALIDCQGADKAVNQILNNRANCSDFKTSPPPLSACPVGQVMTGLRANGTLICAARP